MWTCDKSDVTISYSVHKHEAISTVLYLNEYVRSQNRTIRTLRTDGDKSVFDTPRARSIISSIGATQELSAPYTSYQNGKAERTYRTIKQIALCLLRYANLGPEFEMYALQHAVYIYNRIPHTGNGHATYGKYTSTYGHRY